MAESFKVSTTVTAQRVEDLLCCGMESGPYDDLTIVGYEPKELADQCTYPHLEVPFKGGAILMKDKYGDSSEVYKLNRAALQRGLDVMAEKSPYQMGEFMNENEDVITGTLFIQCALLGEVVYG
jgi:hypothetical protein